MTNYRIVEVIEDGRRWFFFPKRTFYVEREQLNYCGGKEWYRINVKLGSFKKAKEFVRRLNFRPTEIIHEV